MSRILLFNKPFNVLCQFSDPQGRECLQNYITTPGFYPAGRLDRDSEGLLVLTDDGQKQHQIAHPENKLSKTYWAQLEGAPGVHDLAPLTQGIELNDGPCLPAKFQMGIGQRILWDRDPPIRVRKNVPTTWITLTIKEGRNRQVRRMCASLGFPVLRLIRYRVGSWTLDGLAAGQNRWA